MRARAAAALLLAAALGLVRCAGGDDPPRTIVLLTLDTLRRDRLGCYGGSAATPRLDALAAQGLRFHDARTPAPLTLPAHVTAMTGRPPAAHGVRSNAASRVPPRDARPWPLLAEEMRAAGLRCGAFVSAQPLARRYGLDAGFEAYDDGDLGEARDAAYAERPGVETVERARAWVAGLPSDARVFLWVHLFEPHDPHPAGGYDADVEACDRAAGALLDALEALGRGDAAVCVVADHGEALGEHGEPTHGFLLAESVLRVPLLLRAPGAPAGAVRRDPADLADVAPTLLALAGRALALPDGPGVGRDLLRGEAPATRPRVAEALHAHHQFRWAQLSAGIANGWKLEDRGLGRERLFRLADDAPPWQDGGVDAAGRPEAEAPADALRRYRQAETARADAGGRAPPGYGAGGAVAPFLEPAANAALPDPYAVVGDARAVFDLEARIGGGDPERLLPRLAVLEARDPGNPYLPFLRGRYERARLVPDPAAAEAAFLRALELGRLDAQTVWLAAGMRADRGDVRGAVDLLSAYADRVRLDVDAFLLEARLRSALGDVEGRRRALERAADAAETGRERARVVAERSR